MPHRKRRPPPSAGSHLPGDFPEAVPRPQGLQLRGFAAAKNPPARQYTLTYAMDGVDTGATFSAYLRALRRAKFDIRASTSGVGDQTQEGRIRAEGKRWDVDVTIGPDPRQRVQLVLSVSTHGSRDVGRVERAVVTEGG
jgi:hypothetical protein